MEVKKEFDNIMKLYVSLPARYLLHEVEKVYKSNPEWVDRVINEDHRLFDVIHDFEGILSNNEHFVPRL